VGASGTDAGLTGTKVLVVAASPAAMFAVTKPGVGTSAAIARASGDTASGVAAPGTGASAAAALGAIGSAEVAAPEVPTSAVTSAVAVEAQVAWTPAGTPSVVRGVELEPVGVDEPATPSSAACCGTPGLALELAPDETGAAEELPGREALANEEKKLFSKKRSTGNKGSERKNTYPEEPGFQRPRRLGDRCCRGGGGIGSCCCGGGGGTRSSCSCCSSCCRRAGGGGGAVCC